MAKTKEQKENEVKELKEKLAKAKIALFATFSKKGKKGLKVNSAHVLKKKLREVDSEFVISKKRLINVALKGDEYIDEINAGGIDGSVGIIFGYDDPMVTTKSVYDFSKGDKAIGLCCAVMTENEKREFINMEKLMELAQLPGMDVLMGRMIGMIQSPMSGMLNVLQGNIRNLVLILSNIKK